MNELTDFSQPHDTTSNIPTIGTATEFSQTIELMASEKRITHLEAVLLFCEKHYLDPEDIATKVTKSLKSKLEQDFRDMNYLPKRAQLDV